MRSAYETADQAAVDLMQQIRFLCGRGVKSGPSDELKQFLLGQALQKDQERRSGCAPAGRLIRRTKGRRKRKRSERWECGASPFVIICWIVET
jgi:hypothetical protein